MKKLFAAILVLSLLLPLCAFSQVVSAQESGEVYASVVSFDNNDLSHIHTSTSYSPGDIDSSGKIGSSDVNLAMMGIVGTVSLSDSEFFSADLSSDGKLTAADVHILNSVIVGKTEVPLVGAEGGAVRFDSKNYKSVISGSGLYRVRIDASDINFKGRKIGCAVIDTDASLSDLEVIPVYNNSETGLTDEKGEFISYNSKGYYRFFAAEGFSGIIVSAKNSGMSFNITKVYFCADDFSAKYVIDNSVLPSVATSKKLVISESKNNIAIRLGQMTQDDATNTNGGLYHDYTNTKWPSVAVDENDKLYIAASGCRMTHVDPFGATVMVTSTDKGQSFSKPKQISNTIKDDRDVGLTYLGGGKLLASYFSPAGESYLPSGENYGVLKLNSAGGGSSSWQADSWDSAGNPVGGINGTYASLLKYIYRTDKSYDMGYHSYIVKSTDYGDSWNAEPYTLQGNTYTSAMEKMVQNYQITYPGLEVPVTTPHGPVLLSDGSVMWVGKVLTDTDLPLKEIAAYVSKDEGDSWSYRGHVSIPCDYTSQDFQEPDITETADGVLVCTLRSFDIFTCFSYDKGATWTTPKQAHLEGISHHIMTMPNGDLVLTSAYRNSPKRIYAYVSEDGGRTWSQKAELSRSFKSDDDMGYPCSVCLSDGTIVTVYYGCAYSSDWNSSIMTTNWKYTLK